MIFLSYIMPFGIKTETITPASQLIKSILNFLSLNLNTIDYFSDLDFSDLFFPLDQITLQQINQHFKAFLLIEKE